MKKRILLFCSGLISLGCDAQVSGRDLTPYYLATTQPCGGLDSILARKGSWKKHSDAVIFPDRSFPRSQFGQLNSRLDKIFPLMKEALPDLSGMEAIWYRVIDGHPYIVNGPMPYEFSSLYLSYICVAPKIELSAETGTWAYVFINQLNWFCDKIGDWNIHDNGKMISLYSLPPKVGEWKGMALYAPRTHRLARAVVIGHEGKLPWHALTRKEYLTGLKNKWLGDWQKQLAGIDETEEKIKKDIDKLKNNSSPEAGKSRQVLEQQLKDYESRKDDSYPTKKFYEEEIRYIDDYLSRSSSEELEQVAVIDPKYNVLKFRGVFGDEKNGGTRIIDIASQYFKKELPRYAPQFMVLYWRWTEGPLSLLFKQQFEDHFPLEKLKALIDE